MTTSAHYSMAMDLMRSGVPVQAAAAMAGVSSISVAALPVSRPSRPSYVPGPRFCQPVKSLPPREPTRHPTTPHDAVIATVESVARRYGLSAREVLAKCNKRHRAYARHQAMAEVQARFGLSLPRIGAIFGGMHHTTVMEGIERHHARVLWGELLIAAGGVR